jgi:hypothetical protein
MLAILFAFLFSSLSLAADLIRDNVAAKYNNFSTSSFNTSDIDACAAAIVGSSLGQGKSNMMALGFLEFAMKDIVHLAYSESDLITSIGNDTYSVPKICKKNGTGTNSSNPAQFINTATWQVDLGPLYSKATRINGTPYLNITSAVNYWLGIHNMSKEFIVTLKFYNEYHYYVARNLEEYFFGQNSVAGAFTRTNANSTVNTVIDNDYVFNKAKTSTIRFAHALLQQSVLQILLDNDDSDILSKGYHYVAFDYWWRRDVDTFQGQSAWNSADPAGSDRPTRQFDGDQPRSTPHDHHLISALDWLLSFRNPNTATTYSPSQNGPSCLNAPSNLQSVPRSLLTNEVLNLLATPVQRFGLIHPAYKKDVKLQIYRARELGLGSYKEYLTQLHLGGSSTDDTNVFKGAHLEVNATRLYRHRLANLIMAAVGGPVNDAIMADDTGYWAHDNDNWIGNHYHPNSVFFPEQDPAAYTFDYCYSVNSVCTAKSLNAAAALFGYHEAMTQEENPVETRSKGALFSLPPQDSPITTDENSNNPEKRHQFMWRLGAEFVNALYYQFNGLESLAVKQSGATTRYLPNQVIDTFPTNIGWVDSVYDGTCQNFLSSTCTRAGSACNMYIGCDMGCYWYW